MTRVRPGTRRPMPAVLGVQLYLLTPAGQGSGFQNLAGDQRTEGRSDNMPHDGLSLGCDNPICVSEALS